MHAREAKGFKSPIREDRTPGPLSPYRFEACTQGPLRLSSAGSTSRVSFEIERGQRFYRSPDHYVPGQSLYCRDVWVENIDLSVAALRGPARGTDSAQRTARRARHDVGRGRDVPRTARAVRRGCGRIAPSILRPRGRHRDHLRGRQGVCGWGRTSPAVPVRAIATRPPTLRPPASEPRPAPYSVADLDPHSRRPLRAGKTHPPREGYHPKKMIEGIYAGYTIRYPGTSPTRRSRARRRRGDPRYARALSLSLSLSLPPLLPLHPPRVSLRRSLAHARPPSLTRPSPSHPLPPQCLTATRREATPR